MKYLLAFSCFLFLLSLQAFSQDKPSFEYQGNIKIGVPMGDFPSIDFSQKEPGISLDKPFDKSDLLHPPVFYHRSPSEMGILFKRNTQPEMDFTLRIQQLPEIGSKMPIQDFPQDNNYTLLIKEYN